MSVLKKLIIVAALLIVLPRARAQEDDDARAGLSRPMKSAIHFYETGDDMQAMDRFMEILTKGDPSERSMANEYINLITHRMNSGGGAGGSPAPKVGTASAESSPAQAPVPARSYDAPAPRTPSAAAPSVAPSATPLKNAGASGGAIVSEGTAAPAHRPTRMDAIDESEAPARKAPRPAPAARSSSSRGEEMSTANKSLMRKEIKSRLHSAQERSLSDLKSVDGVRVVMRENGDPEAIGIPSPLLFQTGISFQHDAVRLLDPLTKLVFALGSTQVLILPEGTALGDAKVLDMRRTMGISSSLYQAGVAPPRVRVNLLNTQVDIPKGLADFKGVVIVFQYDQPMQLSVESAVGDELGPPISLGVFPPQIRPSRNQGAIIEFSVSDPPAGLVSWKFQLLQPSKDGSELAALQEVVGGGPVFHQIFWNGRQNYFGSPLPSGRYECVLTALDAKNRQRTLHRWIQVLPDEGDAEKMLASGPEVASAPETSATSVEKVPASRVAGAAPSEDLAPAEAKPLVKGVKAAAPAAEISSKPKPVAKAKRRVASRAARAKKEGKTAKAAKAAEPDTETSADASRPAPAVGASAAAKTAAPVKEAKPGHYELAFAKNTHQMTAASEKALAKAANDISSYPLETLQVVGHATTDETDSTALADRRAKMVAGLLINRYQVEPKKIQVSSSSGQAATVDLVLARND
jgi:outer membrane protein OmpA-like peptidoglycan-associated protein